ncbi:MAG: hypothetical protein KAJ17_11575, partial [Candidatus Krumholzibacteria bacterium]|nr:hypothetical protein [Candidatus Krumholzibacteria bacterium]
ITRMNYSGGHIVFKHLVNGHFPAGSHHVAWDMKTDDGADVTPWWPGTKVILYLDGAPMDTVGIRFFDAP